MSSYRKSDEAARHRLDSMAPPELEPAPVQAPSGPDQREGRTVNREACMMRLDRIEPDPDQPRKEIDPEGLQRLADSLKTRGQLQPIRIRWDESRGVYLVVLGERRYQAAKIAGLSSLSCVVVTGSATPEELLEDQLVENCLREDLKPIELANAYKRLMTRLGISQAELAKRLNVAQSAVSQAVSMLTLPEPIKARVDSGELAPSVAYELSKFSDPDEQAIAADQSIAGKTTLSDVRARAKAAGKSRRGKSSPKPRKLTVRLIRTPTGGRVTVEHRKGLDGMALVAELESALAIARAETEQGSQAAA